MKLFHKPTDERVVAEVNRVYKIGYYILTFGMLLDLCIRGIELRRSGAPFGVSYWFGFGVFLLAQIVCVMLMTRRGLMDDNAFAESDVFPTKHYLLLGLATGAVSAAILSVFNYCTSAYWVSYSAGMLFAAVAIQFVVVVPVVMLTMLAVYYLTFRAAKKRRDALQEQAEETEDDAAL